MLRHIGCAIAGVFLVGLLGLAPAAAQQPSGGITPCTGSPPAALTVSTVSSNVQFGICGPTVIVFNTTSQLIYFQLGATNAVVASTNSIPLPGNTYLMLTVPQGAAGYWLAAITPTGSSLLQFIQGQSISLPVASSGGAGGGSGGGPATLAVGAVVGGAYLDGAIVTLGSTTDAPCTLPASTTACSLIAVSKAAANGIVASIAAGSAIIGKVGIDQTTPGVTNNVTASPLPAAARNTPGCTVGISSGTCLAASTAVSFLQLSNNSATSTNNVACNIVGGTAVLNSATSVQLSPGQTAYWGVLTGGVPTGAINCIATNASTPLYVEWK